MTSIQIRRVVVQHSRQESELEVAEKEYQQVFTDFLEADTKVVYLQRLKKIWIEKMIRTISRGFSDVEELERVKVEKAARDEGF